MKNNTLRIFMIGSLLLLPLAGYGYYYYYPYPVYPSYAPYQRHYYGYPRFTYPRYTYPYPASRVRIYPGAQYYQWYGRQPYYHYNYGHRPCYFNGATVVCW